MEQGKTALHSYLVQRGRGLVAWGSPLMALPRSWKVVVSESEKGPLEREPQGHWDGSRESEKCPCWPSQ